MIQREACILVLAGLVAYWGNKKSLFKTIVIHIVHNGTQLDNKTLLHMRARGEKLHVVIDEWN